MYGWRAQIGLLTPSVNTVSEVEWNVHVPEGVSVHAARLLLDRDVTPASIEAMNEDIERACESVATADVDAVVYGVTAGSFLEAAGFDVVALSARGIDDGAALAAPTPGSAYRQAKRFDSAEADAVYISGMNYHVLPMLPKLEADLGKPVLSSNQVSIWDALRTVDVDYSGIELGTLFEQ